MNNDELVLRRLTNFIWRVRFEPWILVGMLMALYVALRVM